MKPSFAALKSKQGKRQKYGVKLSKMTKGMPCSAQSAPLILQLSAAGDGQMLPMGLQGFPTEADGTPIYYRKVKIAGVGRWEHRTDGYPIDITAARADEWVKNVKALSAAGVKPFIPGQHRDSFNASDNYGYIVDISREGQDVNAIFALYGDDARKAAAVNSRSIFVVSDAKDANGKVYPGETIAHVALTPCPALPDLGGTQKIAASAAGPAIEAPIFNLAGERTAYMKPENIQKLRASFAEQLKDVKDEAIPDILAEMALDDAPAPEVTALSAENKKLKTNLEEANTKVLSLSASAPKEPDALSLSLITESLDSKRSQAIESGTISEAGAKALDKLMMPNGKPSALALSAGAGDTRPILSRIWEIIRDNPGVKISGGTKRSEALGLSAAAPVIHNTFTGAVEEDPAKVLEEAGKFAADYQQRQLAARGLVAAK